MKKLMLCLLAFGSFGSLTAQATDFMCKVNFDLVYDLKLWQFNTRIEQFVGKTSVTQKPYPMPLKKDQKVKFTDVRMTLEDVKLLEEVIGSCEKTDWDMYPPHNTYDRKIYAGKISINADVAIFTGGNDVPVSTGKLWSICTETTSRDCPQP